MGAVRLKWCSVVGPAVQPSRVASRPVEQGVAGSFRVLSRLRLLSFTKRLQMTYRQAGAQSAPNENRKLSREGGIVGLSEQGCKVMTQTNPIDQSHQKLVSVADSASSSNDF